MVDENTLTAGDLKKLPLRALAALLVRAVKRHRPNFDLPGATPDRHEHMNAVDQAILLLWKYACGQDLSESAGTAVANALTAATAGPSSSFGIPAHKAAMALGAIMTALYVSKLDWAIDRALQALMTMESEPRLIREDYDKLLRLSLGAFPEPGQPIDPSTLGEI